MCTLCHLEKVVLCCEEKPLDWTFRFLNMFLNHWRCVWGQLNYLNINKHHSLKLGLYISVGLERYANNGRQWQSQPADNWICQLCGFWMTFTTSGVVSRKVNSWWLSTCTSSTHFPFGRQSGIVAVNAKHLAEKSKTNDYYPLFIFGKTVPFTL